MNCTQHAPARVTYAEDKDGDGCPICEHLKQLADHAKTLTDQLTKQAIVVTGNSRISTARPIGLLQVLGGTVTISAGVALGAIQGRRAACLDTPGSTASPTAEPRTGHPQPGPIQHPPG